MKKAVLRRRRDERGNPGQKGPGCVPRSPAVPVRREEAGGTRGRIPWGTASRKARGYFIVVLAASTA